MDMRRLLLIGFGFLLTTPITFGQISVLPPGYKPEIREVDCQGWKENLREIDEKITFLNNLADKAPSGAS